MSRKHYQPNSKIVLLLFSLLFLILLLGTWVSSVLVQERQDLRNQASTLLSCNQSCTSHSQCQSNFICFDSHCRLSTNPTDTSCQGIPDQGIHRSCNQYCADNNECAEGLVCYYNACRNPYNISSDTCTIPSPIPTKIPSTATSVTQKPTPTPTATVPPKGGVFDTVAPTKIPINNIQQNPTPFPTVSQSYPSSILDSSSTTQSDPFTEVATKPTFNEILTSIPSYMWYGIGTLIIFFISLLIYIIHTWKTSPKTRKTTTNMPASHQPYDMKSFAGNMDAHIKKE